MRPDTLRMARRLRHHTSHYGLFPRWPRRPKTQLHSSSATYSSHYQSTLPSTKIRACWTRHWRSSRWTEYIAKQKTRVNCFKLKQQAITPTQSRSGVTKIALSALSSSGSSEASSNLSTIHRVPSADYLPLQMGTLLPRLMKLPEALPRWSPIAVRILSAMHWRDSRGMVMYGRCYNQDEGGAASGPIALACSAVLSEDE